MDFFGLWAGVSMMVWLGLWWDYDGGSLIGADWAPKNSETQELHSPALSSIGGRIGLGSWGDNQFNNIQQ